MELQVEEVAEGVDPMVDILAPVGHSRVALTLIKIIRDLTRSLWQSPSALPPTVKKRERKYFVPCKDHMFLYTRPPLGSLVVAAANECERQGQQGPTPMAKNTKKLDIFGRKVYYTIV